MGAITHKDSMGNGRVIETGDFQYMSAGSGVQHSEFNPSRANKVHLLQIWIMTSKKGIDPSYEQKTIDAKAIQNHFARIAAPAPQAGEVRIVQDAEIWAAKLDPDIEILHNLAPGRREAWAVLSELNEIGISANAIPLAYDPLEEPACSGLRFGTTALASRGFGREEFAEVGEILSDALALDAAVPTGSLANRVALLTAKTPLYGYLP